MLSHPLLEVVEVFWRKHSEMSAQQMVIFIVTCLLAQRDGSITRWVPQSLILKTTKMTSASVSRNLDYFCKRNRLGREGIGWLEKDADDENNVKRKVRLLPDEQTTWERISRICGPARPQR